MRDTRRGSSIGPARSRLNSTSASRLFRLASTRYCRARPSSSSAEMITPRMPSSNSGRPSAAIQVVVSRPSMRVATLNAGPSNNSLFS
jgi:hypothetical protein